MGVERDRDSPEGSLVSWFAWPGVAPSSRVSWSAWPGITPFSLDLLEHNVLVQDLNLLVKELCVKGMDSLQVLLVSFSCFV